ncbi:hypothetical protein PAHAL_4G002700, partial [Panicum hallii]
ESSYLPGPARPSLARKEGPHIFILFRPPRLLGWFGRIGSGALTAPPPPPPPPFPPSCSAGIFPLPPISFFLHSFTSLGFPSLRTRKIGTSQQIAPFPSHPYKYRISPSSPRPSTRRLLRHGGPLLPPCLPWSKEADSTWSYRQLPGRARLSNSLFGSQPVSNSILILPAPGQRCRQINNVHKFLLGM